MQKKLIALAIAGLSTAAFAQSNVEVYGQVDAFVGNVSADGIKSLTKVESGGLAASRLGVKGVEDLGNGLKALFVLEYGINGDQNQALGTAGARQQLLGLTGAFGTVAAGRLQTTGYDWGVAYDVLAGTKISPLQNMNSNTAIIGATAAGARANNALAYISPSLNGVTLAVNYTGNLTADEVATATDGDNTNLKATLASAKYDNGPLSAGLVYAKANSDALTGKVLGVTFAGEKVETKDWALGGSYNFGVATLKATYQTTEATVNGDVASKQKTYSLGAAAPVSAAGTVVGSYASTKTSDVDNSQAKSWTVAYLHALSKRTTAYAGYNRVTNDSGVAFTVVNSGLTLANGATSSVAVVGLNHKF